MQPRKIKINESGELRWVYEVLIAGKTINMTAPFEG